MCILHSLNPTLYPLPHYLPPSSSFSFQEQTHSVELQGQLHSNTVLNRAVVELQEMVDDLRAEKDILKKANDKLMKRYVLYMYIFKYPVICI